MSASPKSMLKPPRLWLTLSALAVVAVGAWWMMRPGGEGPSPEKVARQGRAPVQVAKVELDLTEKQASALRVGPVARTSFDLVRQAVGNIDFNQNMLVPVFTPYQGRIIATFAKVGERVARGQILFTVDSPDLLQAENTLIAAAGTAVLQARNLKRATENLRGGGGAQKDVDQATSDQQAAEGALRTARDAVRIFGKTEEEIDAIIAGRKADPTLIVRSSIDGVVTQSVGAPGLFIQPGNAPAPFTIADTSTMWMIANAVEADSATLRVGQPVTVRVPSLPNRVFDGVVVVVGASVDMQTRRIVVRSEIKNPDGMLRAGMFANFTIKVGEAANVIAVPDAAVVREGDGTMTLWVTTNRRRFEKRTVKIGLRQNGMTEIVDGVAPGELVVTEGALFLSNMLAAGPTG